MNALRFHKGTVPGAEKARQTRRWLQESRQRAARGSLLQGLRTFLTADSFMYGPLLEPPPPPPPSPSDHTTSDDSQPHTPEKEKENEGDGVLARETPTAKEGDASAGNNNDNGNPDETPTRSRISKTILSYQRMTRSGLTVVPPAAAPDDHSTPTSTARVSVTVAKMQVNGDGERLFLGDPEDETSSMVNSSDDEGHGMLDNELACKVVQMLLSKVGGRYSTELGINVDAGDEEVEKWFLAVTLFHRHLTFDVRKKTFQKLVSANIVSVGGMLHMEEDEIADILESAGYTTYKHRAAARLRKLAFQLETHHEGRVSSLKQIQDPHELCRHISNLHGLTANTCQEFLRELRDVWPGAAADYDRRTNRASMHADC